MQCHDHRHRLGFTRRESMQIGFSALAGIGLNQFVGGRASANPAAKDPPARAKRMLLVLLSGGLSHHDTLDMKPQGPAEIRGDAAGTIGARDWSTAKKTYADRVVDIIERYAPGTKAKVLGRYVESPADLERKNPNLVGGDNLAGSHHLSQNFLFRPMAGWADWRTPVKNLYLIGASTWPGAGTGAGSGYMLAKMLAK